MDKTKKRNAGEFLYTCHKSNENTAMMNMD